MRMNFERFKKDRLLKEIVYRYAADQWLRIRAGFRPARQILPDANDSQTGQPQDHRKKYR